MPKREIDIRSDKQTEQIARSVSNEFTRITRELLAEVDKGRGANANAFRVLSEYASAIVSSGRAAAFSDFLDLYESRAKDVLKIIKDAGKYVVYTGADAAVIDAVVNTDFDVMGNSIGLAGGSVRQQVIRGIVLGQSAQIDVEGLGGRLESHIKTEIRTGEMAFSRTITALKSKDLGVKKYEYVGPLDNLTREFCRGVVGHTYTEEEIKGMDNEQGLPVLEYGGGYNCRHIWLPVFED